MKKKIEFAVKSAYSILQKSANTSKVKEQVFRESQNNNQRNFLVEWGEIVSDQCVIYNNHVEPIKHLCLEWKTTLGTSDSWINNISVLTNNVLCISIGLTYQV